MEIRFFRESDFETFADWFADEKLNAELGPIDQEWLDYILAEEPPSQFACLINNELVAVVGICHAKNETDNHFVITDIAVAPKLKRTGLGSKALREVINRVNPTHSWLAYVDHENVQAHHFFQSQGWKIDTEKTESAKDMVCFCRNQL